MVNTKIRLIILFAAKDGEAKTRPGADCGSDDELLYCQIQTYIEESRENH